MLRSDSATREALFGSCAPPSSAPELGRAFWGQLLPSHHRAGPRAHPRGRIQQGSPVGVPCLLVPWGLGLFPPRVPAAASCLQQPQVVGFKPGAIPLRASTPPDDKNSAKPQIHPQTSPAMGTHIQDCHIHGKPSRLTLLATEQVKNGANPCGDRDGARLCPPGRRHPAPRSALGLPQLAPGDGGEQRAGSKQGVSGGV